MESEKERERKRDVTLSRRNISILPKIRDVPEHMGRLATVLIILPQVVTILK